MAKPIPHDASEQAALVGNTLALTFNRLHARGIDPMAMATGWMGQLLDYLATFDHAATRDLVTALLDETAPDTTEAAMAEAVTRRNAAIQRLAFAADAAPASPSQVLQ